jgi:hypothetical protein
VPFYDFLFLKNDGNVPSKINKHVIKLKRKKNIFAPGMLISPLFIFLSFPYKANSGAYDLISNVKILFLFYH